MRTALVSGGNRGIGLAIVAGLAAEGMHVLLGARDLAKGKAAAASIKGSVTPVELDVGDKAKLDKQLQTICEQHPSISVLVNNAGILREGDALKVSDENFGDSMQVNALGAYQIIRALAPQMIDAEYGRIVNVSSGWGSMSEGLSGPAAYSISKATMNAITLSTARSLPRNIKINSMCPGWVRTDMGGAAAERSPEEGAATAIWLATLPDNGPSGKFFRDKSEIDW